MVVCDQNRMNFGECVKAKSGRANTFWAKQTKNDQPGPGNYAEVPSTFGTTKGVATMGGKYREERNMNPGPGQYDNDASKLKPKTGASVRIGSAKREELFRE